MYQQQPQGVRVTGFADVAFEYIYNKILTERERRHYRGDIPEHQKHQQQR
jgi:hypothetical protein